MLAGQRDTPCSACVIYASGSEAPDKEACHWNTRSLFTEVHASTGCVRRHSAVSVVSPPLAPSLAFYLLHIVAVFINYFVAQSYKIHIYPGS